ncbi:hypothetical protein EBU71_01685 [bacterium]|nr:hypothetical protein [Candidatus Elulimicrobium humile]
MADQKISDLTAATSAAGADLFTLVQGGSNKKITITNFLANLNSAVIVNSNGADQDTRISGDNDNNLFFTDASADKVGIGTSTPSEKLDVAGNLAISNGFLTFSQTPQSATGNAAASLSTAITNFTLSSGSDSLSLAAGSTGQVKIINVIAGAGNVSINVATRVGFTTVNSSTVGASITLLALASGWIILSSRGMTIV